MKIIYNKWFPFGQYKAINLFGVLFSKYQLNSFDINHERIHTFQQKELLYIFFYIWYAIEWLVRLIQYKNTTKAYYNISFEQEAYANEKDLAYLYHRKRYSFLKYL